METDPAFHPQRSDGLTLANPDGAKPGVAFVPCSPDFDPDECRTYGGVKARILAVSATALQALQKRQGWGAMLHDLVRLPRQVEHGLYIYTRVKATMAKLVTPISIEMGVRSDGTYETRYPIRIPAERPQGRPRNRSSLSPPLSGRR